MINVPKQIEYWQNGAIADLESAGILIFFCFSF
jgi:hypothetical protein